MAAAPRPGRRKGRGTAVKIVITGPFAAGKTTLIRTVSEITVLSTERDVSDATRVRKAETTVAMDFGRITIDSELVLYLFGTPGQDRFDFMWELLSEGMLGFVLLVDGEVPDGVAQAVGILDAFRRNTPQAPFVVAVNKVAEVSDELLAAVRAELSLASTVPVLPCDATEKASVKRVLLGLLQHVLAGLDGADGPGAPTDAVLAEV
ncbi:MAG: small GTP-binding protein [Mycobacterium sp.]|nr:small GTP-binding protein [Mycobacterium sp.]